MARWIIQTEEGGLGEIRWQGEADGVRDALRKWCEADGIALPQRPTDRAVDVNGDGSRWEWHDWSDVSLVAERDDATGVPADSGHASYLSAAILLGGAVTGAAVLGGLVRDLLGAGMVG